MSVSISIMNNVPYCQERNMVRFDHVDCECTWKTQCGSPLDNCQTCGGSGEEKFPVYQFDMNLSNRNFGAVWRELGLELDWCGTIKPQTLSAAIMRVCEANLVSDSVVTQEPGKCSTVDFGRTMEQVNSYFNRLLDICYEAERREEDICWC
jgi:hypothetical protein